MPNDLSTRIVIVDDQASIRHLIFSSLQHIGYRNLVECADGEEALNEVFARMPNLVISDLNMPKLDGLGLLRALRTKPGFEKIPFILLTSRAETDIVKKALELKVNNYLVKPFALDTLKRKIETVIGPLA
ncbi:MAG: two-component system, chemotaxis family, chemotaxis protein CheY [Alphaproteobacteria bacterium]|nr:two-component system, chemotaxis family, chemotaxis protein CheY [Alphaproteobacteria bacterium]